MLLLLFSTGLLLRGLLLNRHGFRLRGRGRRFHNCQSANGNHVPAFDDVEIERGNDC